MEDESSSCLFSFILLIHHFYSSQLTSGIKPSTSDVSASCLFWALKRDDGWAYVPSGFNSLVGGIMGFSILISAEVFKHEPKVWYLDGTVGVLMGLIILAYGVK